MTRTGIERDLGIARKRLGDIPAEMDRLIEGYGKGLIPDDRMRLRMSALTVERDELTKTAMELEQKLQRLQAVEDIEDHVLAFVEKVRGKVDMLDAGGRRRLLELVLEDGTCHSDHAIVRTVIPPPDTELSGQLGVPPQEGGQRDEVNHPTSRDARRAWPPAWRQPCHRAVAPSP